MLLRQLEYVAAIADCGSFTGAARRCHISQPAMSQQVKALEEELGGMRVFERGTRHVELTSAGELVLQAAHDVLSRTRRLQDDLHTLEGGRPRLRVGCLNRFDPWTMRAAVAAFTLRHPHVDVSVTFGTHEELYEALSAGTLDAAVNDRRRELSPSFENVHLMACELVVELSGAHPLAQRDALSPAELSQTPCILVTGAEREHEERAYFSRSLGFEGPFRRADTLDEARMLVAGNHGALPLEVPAGTRQGGTVIRQVSLAGPSGPFLRDYYVFWPKPRTSWLTKELARILCELVRDGRAARG